MVVEVPEVRQVELEEDVVGPLRPLAESKGAARKLIEGGGVYLYNQRQTDAQKQISTEDIKWPGAILLPAWTT